MTAEVFLKIPIHQLVVSKQFCDQCKMMGFATLGEIVRTSPEEIVKKEGFSYHWLSELSELLKKEDLLRLLQPLPGSSHD